MLTNALKKGDRIQMRNGFFGTILDNKKGNVRMVEVEGYVTEAGSVYSHDIAFFVDHSAAEYGSGGQEYVAIEHTKEQLARKEYIKNGGW